MLGPKAPKDAQKKRPGYYIMREKEIAFAPKEDGSGVCYIYENDGRLLSASRLVGNISDEGMLDMLKTTQDFRKLVHSIGVTVDMENPESDVTFVLQMYGIKSVYESGTSIEAPIHADGMEYILDLNEVEWTGDDKEPGQIRFEYVKSAIKAHVSVKFYLNDGFTAPEPEEIRPVDTESAEYQKIIEKSLYFKGNNYRVKKAIEKARKGEQTTVAFIGGSITQGAGAVPINTGCYAYKTFEGFCALTGRGVQDNVQYIKAGVGGTPSEFGMLRYQREVVDECEGEGPDLVVVEFAVNDEGDETKGECFESLARKIYDGPGKPAVIFIFAVFANDWNLCERLAPVGKNYSIPIVNTLDSVVEQFKLPVNSGRVISKSQYFYDMYHPTNYGHTIMADGIINLLKIMDKDSEDEEIVSLKDYKTVYGCEFENVELLDKLVNNCGAVINCGNFTEEDKVLQYVERNLNLHGTPELTGNWMHPSSDRSNTPFSMDVKCSALLLIFKDSAENITGKADIFVDGTLVLSADPHEVGWTHCNPVIILRAAENKVHHVEIKMAPGDEEKEFTILGFGVVSK